MLCQKRSSQTIQSQVNRKPETGNLCVEARPEGLDELSGVGNPNGLLDGLVGGL